MAKYLDEQGLSTLVTAIKAEDKKITDKLGTIRTSHTVEGDIEALEGLVGSTSVSSQIDAKLTAAGVGTAENIGTRLTAAENKLTTIQGAANVDGSIAKVLADAKSYTDGKDTAMDGRVDKLESTHATKTENGSTRFQTVAEEVATGISNLRDGADAAFDTLKEIANWINDSDAAKTGFNAANRITTLEGKHASGKTVAQEISAVTGTPDSGKTLQAEIDAVEASISTLNSASTVSGSVAKAVADEATARNTAISTAINALDATVRGNMDTSDAVTAAQKVGVKVVEADGKITGVTVVTNDIASASALTTLTGRVDAITSITDATINGLFA